MHPESDYGQMIGGLFANASAASPPAVYFANSPPIIHLLSTGTNVMGLCLRKRHCGQAPINPLNIRHRTVNPNQRMQIDHCDRGYLRWIDYRRCFTEFERRFSPKEAHNWLVQEAIFGLFS